MAYKSEHHHGQRADTEDICLRDSLLLSYISPHTMMNKDIGTLMKRADTEYVKYSTAGGSAENIGDPVYTAYKAQSHSSFFLREPHPKRIMQVRYTNLRPYLSASFPMTGTDAAYARV
jgi:hypothetical protein